jgi:hypothetical protein
MNKSKMNIKPRTSNYCVSNKPKKVNKTIVISSANRKIYKEILK